MKNAGIILFFFCLIFTSPKINAQSYVRPVLTEKEKALDFLQSIDPLTKSQHWQNISPDLFMRNLRRNIEEPDFLYAGRNTNFCSYAALGYVLLKEDPLGYVQFMTELYQNGKAVYGNTTFTPSQGIKETAGQLFYEGELDRNEADQVLFFTLADHFKGYLNILNRHYNPGDEQTMWASTNLSKFNRMLRAMFKTEIHSTGADLARPKIPDLTAFLNDKLSHGNVFLYLNNTVLHRKFHHKTKKRIPTHYVVLLGITEKNNTATITFWDAGYKTRKTINMHTLRWILYGISWSVNKTQH